MFVAVAYLCESKRGEVGKWCAIKNWLKGLYTSILMAHRLDCVCTAKQCYCNHLPKTLVK